MLIKYKLNKMSLNCESSQILNICKLFNNFLLSDFNSLSKGSGDYYPLRIGEESIGLVSRQVYEKLINYPKVFELVKGKLYFKSELGDYAKRSIAVSSLLEELKRGQVFSTLSGWRGECFEIKSCGGYSGDGLEANSLFEMERSATCLFGLRQFGVDINGYVMHPVKGLCIWLQKRADNKQTWPGMMDNMVGGGLSVGYSVIETALKEASEEAGIGQDLLKDLTPCGSVSFYFQSERGLFPNTEFVFDLQLPLEFIPVNQDGEVSDFKLLTAKEALECVLSPSFKTTSCPVTLDFLVRHGVINSSNEPHLPQILELLHSPLTQLYNNL